MTFPLDSSHTHSQHTTPPIHIEEEYDDSSCSDAEETSNRHQLATRTPFIASQSSSSNLNYQIADRCSNQNLLYPHHPHHSSEYTRSNVSLCSTASATPIPSRSNSPAPLYIHTSSCSSGTDSESESAFMSTSLRRGTTWRERPRWWQMGGSRRRRRREAMSWFRTGKRIIRKLIRHPFVPKTPLTIILTLVFLTAFGVSLTFLLIYILNPDKEPLPWRGYCTIPNMSTAPPPATLPPGASFPFFPHSDFSPPSFPPDNLDSLSPAGVLVGVFSLDTAVERRMMVRSTWASHPRSRDGAGEGDGGIGTSRTIVRFILGQPRKEWERRIRLEMETFKDIIILPVSENMNGGKSHAFFTWASTDAWVPPLYSDTFAVIPKGLSYSNATSIHPTLAFHDPIHAQLDVLTNDPKPWVRPDFVVKSDDDSFLMLAELEARLRVELHAKPPRHRLRYDETTPSFAIVDQNNSAIVPPSPLDPAHSQDSHTPSHSSNTVISTPSTSMPLNDDPLVYWGYLVKNRFMAGELYALSFSLVDWVAKDTQVKSMIKGAEDKQTSKWMRIHPRAGEIRWASERCWIYDHPRAGTVYSHGFLFPSEIKRVQRDVKFDLEHHSAQQVFNTGNPADSTPISPFGPYGTSPSTWSRSTVSTFGVRYSLPMQDLTMGQSVEALVEGSEMSRLREGSLGAADYAWRHREGRNKRYDNKRVGGTIVVHFIKKNMWFLEAAFALLEGEETTEIERTIAGAVNALKKGFSLNMGHISHSTNSPAGSRGHPPH